MKASFIALVCWMLAALEPVLAATPPAPAVTPPHQVNFAASDNVIALKSALTPYHAPGGPEKDGSLWYMLALTNDLVRPVSRVILAGQPPGMALAILPHSSRPQI